MFLLYLLDVYASEKKKMKVKQLNKILSGIKCDSFSFNFATNTIMFQFFNKEKQVDYLLVIEPQWRILKQDKLISSSLSCPWHEDYKKEGEYDIAFKEWCKAAKHLKEISISGLSIVNELGDIMIEWSDGSRLETLISFEDEEYWCLYDNKKQKKYGVGYQNFNEETINSK